MRLRIEYLKMRRWLEPRSCALGASTRPAVTTWCWLMPSVCGLMVTPELSNGVAKSVLSTTSVHCMTARQQQLL